MSTSSTENSMTARILLATALSVVCSLASAAAPDAQTPVRPGPGSLDKNGDGYLSRDEVSSHPRLAESFERLDANKDGLLSTDELRAAAPATASRHKWLDAGDGSISRDEAKTAPRLAERFDQIDANKDGALSRDEMATWRKTHPRPAPGAPVEPIKP
jgi:Ca2+-binding EF-hand superfamily protein